MKARSSKRLFMTMTGAIKISQDTMNSLKLSARDTLVNSNRGKVSLLVENSTDSPVCIYRNKKLAKFSTFHPVEINSLNIAAAQCYENYNQSKTNGSDYSSAERPSENNHVDNFFKGFSTDYGRYRSQQTTKKSQEKSSVIFAQNVCKVAHPNTDFKIGFS